MEKYALIASADKLDRPRVPTHNQAVSPAMIRQLSSKRRTIDLSLLMPLLIIVLLIGLKPADSRAQETTFESNIYCPNLGLDTADCARVERVTARGWQNDSVASAFNTLRLNPQGSSDLFYCLNIDVSLPAGTRIDFNWAVNSNSQNHRLHFYINNSLQQTVPDQDHVDGRFASVQQYADYPDEAEITFLQWCQRRPPDGLGTSVAAAIERLNFVLPSEIRPSPAPPTRTDYCSALNLAPTIQNSPCDLVDSVEPVFPDYPWRSSSFDAVENSDRNPIGPNSIALRSAVDLPNGAESCVRLRFKLELPFDTQIIFYGATYSEANNDFLKFYSGENEVYSRSGSRPAPQSAYSRVQRVILAPTDNLTWCYEKDDNFVASQDAARIDVLSIEAPAMAARNPANFRTFCSPWLTSGFNCDQSNAGAITYTADYPWEIAGDALTNTSNLINNSQTCVSVKVSQLPLRSRVRFSWSADIHSSDFLGFYINGRLLGEVTDTGSSYQNASFVADQFEDISDTASVLSWCYVTDVADTHSNDFIGLDGVRIDAMQFRQTGFTPADYCEQLGATEQCSLLSGMTFAAPPGFGVPWERLAARAGRDSNNEFPIRSIRARSPFFNQRRCFILPELNLQADTVIEFQWTVAAGNREDFFRFRLTDGVSASAAADLSITGTSGTPSNRFELVRFRITDPTQARRASWCLEIGPDQNAQFASEARLAQLKFYGPNDLPVVVDNLSAICTTLGLSTGECGLVSQARTNIRQNAWAQRTVTVNSVPETVLTAPNHSPHAGDATVYRQSCLALDVDLPAGTTIRFRWRLTQGGHFNDRFRFIINGNPNSVSIGPSGDFLTYRQPTEQAATELRWCHQINADFDASTKGNAEFYDLSFTAPDQAVSDLPAVCAALDLESTECGSTGLIRSASHTGALPWDISSNQSLGSINGGNALLNTGDLGGFDESCYTLNTLIQLPGGDSLGFFWRLNGVSGDSIRFLVNDGERGRLSGNGEDSGWQVLNIAGPLNILSLQWCYLNPSFQSGEYAVVDALTVGPALTIAPRPDGQRQPLDNPGLQRFQVNVNAQQDYVGTISQSEIELTLLSRSSRIVTNVLAVESWTNTAAQLYGLDFTVQFDAARLLRQGTTSGEADSIFAVSIPDFPATQAGGYQIQVANSELLRDILCLVLDVSTTDCAAIVADSVANTQDPVSDFLPRWFITSEAARVFSGQQALAVTGMDQPSRETLFSLAVDVNLPAGTGVQFYRLLDTDCCNRSRFNINDVRRERASQNFAESEAYVVTRLYAASAVPITRLTWEYSDLNSSESASGRRVWIDQLSFIPPVTTVARLCSVLDVDDDDCTLIESVTAVEAPWVEILNTGADNSLRLHPGAARNRSSCLVLDVNLPANTRVDFELAYNLPSSGDRFRLYEGLEVEDDLLVSAGGMHETHRQQRFFSNTVRTLRWCLAKADNAAADAEFLELNRLSFTSGSAARLLPDRQTLCIALDLNSTVCPLLDSSFTQSPEHLQWRTSGEVTPVRGDGVISAPATLPGETSCLNLSFTGLQAGLSVSFNWWVNGSTADTLSFSINGNQVQSLRGTGATARWVSVSQPPTSAETVINSLQWCYTAGSGSTTAGQAWIDNLQFGFATSALAATTPMQAADMPNRFSFVVTVTASPGDGNLPTSAQFVLEPQTLGISSVSYVVTAQSSPGTGLFRRAFAVTADIELNALVETGMLRLSQPGWPLTGNPQSEVVFDDLAALRQVAFCQALALSEQDCNRLTAVGSTADYPWEIGNAVAGSVRRTLRSGGSNDTAVNSCLQLELALATGSRIDFLWALGIGTGDRFRFLANNLSVVDLMAQADAPIEEWQQRLSTTAIDSLSWCYSHSSGSSNRGLFRQLSFQPPAQAALIASKEALCAALDTGDCEQISSFTQQHADSTTLQLSWAVTDAQSVTGDSSLRTPLSVPANGESCLKLAVDLSANAQFRFSWQVDSAATDFLRFRVGETVINSISGSLADNPWREIIHSLTAPAEEISWCFDDTAGASAGQSLGWIDQLRFRTAVEQTVEAAILMSTEPEPTQPLQGQYVFTVTVGDFHGFQPLPEGLQLTATAMENISRIEMSDTLNLVSRIYTIDVTLQNPNLPAQLTLGLGGVESRLLRADQTTVTVRIAGSVSSILCPPLDLSTEDCGRISSISSHGAWRLTTATFQTGSNLFASASGFGDGGASCLILAVNLPAASRIDFDWAVDSETGDQLQFAVNGEIVTMIDGLLSTAPPERQQRFSAAAVTELSWCYRKNRAGSAGADRGWLDNLAFFVNTQAPLLPNRAALCTALDLGGNDCDPISSFSQTHSPDSNASLSWAVTSEQSMNGGSSLRSPLTVPETGESCLVLSTALPSHTRIRFHWQVDSAAADFLRFRVGDTVIASISGSLADNRWNEIDHLQETAFDSISWCFDDTAAASAGLSIGWVDQLQLIPLPQFIITRTSAATALPEISLGHRRFVVTAEDGNNGFNVVASLKQLSLNITEQNNLVSSIITSATTAENAKRFTVTLQLQNIDASSLLTIALNHSDTNLLAAVRSSRTLLLTAHTAAELLCPVLDLSDEDCALISGFGTTAEYPWRVTTTTFQVGENLLTSAREVADDGASCLTLSLNLQAGSRIDFSWSINSLRGDALQFSINNLPAIGIEGILPVHRQQRFGNTATISNLSWCYRKDSSNESGLDRGWIDQLDFLPSGEAALLGDKQALCTALDLSAADCAAISTVSQAPDSLSWAVVADIAVDLTPNGGSALGSPLTVTVEESACLTLQTTLPAGTVLRFNWQNDGDISSVLNLQLNGAPAAGISINGPPITDRTIDSWQTQSHTSAAALNSLGWCYRRDVGFAGLEQGWLDQLSLEPPFTYPQITLSSQPTRVTDNNNNAWQFLVTISFAANAPGTPSLPAGLQLSVTSISNISAFTITVANSDSTMISNRISVTLETDNIGIIRFGLSSLPAAVEPVREGLSVAIEPVTVALVTPALARLVDDPGGDEAISLPDLLLGLRIVDNPNLDTPNNNLPGGVGGDSASNTADFMTLLGNSEQNGVIDIDTNGAIDSLDFRLMVRYRAGLRGTALCDDFCLIRLQLLLDQ